MESLHAYLLILTILAIILLLLRPGLRTTLINKVLFPPAYKLYTSRIVGYTFHSIAFMSSPSNPSKAHSIIDAVKTYGEGDGSFQVVPIPVLGDNFSYLLLHKHSKTCALVDPADPHPVTQVLEQHSDYKLTHILTTHKHWDHAGGNIELLKQFPGITVVGGVGEEVAAANKEVTTGDVVNMAQHFDAHIYQCPCHTKGHILFGIENTLFTGDTLFAGGCGRFFEGSASEMYKNLYQTIGPMKDSTWIFPGHEYTVANLEFATWVEPNNTAARTKLEWAEERRAGKFPTIPTTLKEEKEYNPFMRVHQQAVVDRVSRLLGNVSSSPSHERDIRVMDALRTLKNENAHKKKE